MLVAVLIGIMISIVVGVSLVPVILSSTTGIVYTDMSAFTTGAYITTVPLASGMQALVSVLPYVFVAVILLGAVAWIGGQGG